MQFLQKAERRGDFRATMAYGRDVSGDIDKTQLLQVRLAKGLTSVIAGMTNPTL